METIFLLARHYKVLETILVARSLEDGKQQSGWCLLELMSDLGNLEAASRALPVLTTLTSNPSVTMSSLSMLEPLGREETDTWEAEGAWDKPGFSH